MLFLYLCCVLLTLPFVLRKGDCKSKWLIDWSVLLPREVETCLFTWLVLQEFTGLGVYVQAWLLVQTDVLSWSHWTSHPASLGVLSDVWDLIAWAYAVTVERPIEHCLSPVVCLGQTFNISTSSTHNKGDHGSPGWTYLSTFGIPPSSNDVLSETALGKAKKNVVPFKESSSD